MGDRSVLIFQPPRKNQLADELRIAIGRTPPSELSAWGNRAAKRFVSVGVKRVTGLGSLLATITTSSADELVRVISALNANRMGEYAQDRSEKAEQLATLIAGRGQSAFNDVARTLESRPSEAATHLLALVVGFYCGSGGNGDGGIPDLDLLGGIGAHRSIFTHSIIAGAFIETAVMSLVDLIQVVHAKLPESRSEFWDAMLRHTEIGGSTFVSGASIGIATHLTVDTLLDGFTPYKDLPIELPQFAHELLMGLNAAAEGRHGVLRYGDDFQQLVEKPPHTEPSNVDVVVINGAELKGSNQKMLGLDNTMIDSTNAPSNLMPVSEFGPVAELADRVGRKLGIDTSAVNGAIDLASRRISQANGPFCLGVVGEFRVGKSTLINALLGQEVAFTDFMEATPVICRFRSGPQRGATILFCDGCAESMTVEECNSVLDQRRHDKQWTSGISWVEYQIPAETLTSFDLWDAPGLGGSEENDLVAQNYVGLLGGAIWVLDATLVGKAAIASPIARMHADGKPIVCVLNRIDETKDDPETLRKWVADAYPGIFSEIVTFSAQKAFESAACGNVSDESKALWDVIKHAMGNCAGEGNSKRISLASANAKGLVAAKLDDIRREIQDRVGALDHFRMGLEEAKRQTLQAVGKHLNERADSVFSDLTSRAQGELEKSNWSASSIDKVVLLLSDSKMLSEISKRVADEALKLANDTWLRVSDESLTLSRAAVPMDDLVSDYRVDRPVQAKEEAVRHGVYVGGMTAIATGTLAAISTIVTWPIILAAIPVGALAMWKKRQDVRASEPELMAQITDLISQMKEEYIKSARPEIESRVEAAIHQQVERYLADKRAVLLHGANPNDVVHLIDEIQSISDELRGPSDAEARIEWSGPEMLELLGNPGSRLDVVIQDLSFSLFPILSELPAGTEVRLVFNADGLSREEHEKRIANAFESWPGRKRIKAISAENEVILPTILMTQDRCFISESSLGHLLEEETTFREFEGGRLAGQHLFAGLWEGSPYKGIPLVTTPVH